MLRLITILFLTSIACIVQGAPIQLSEEIQSRIACKVTQAINAGQTPGAVILVGQEDKILYEKAFGSLSHKNDSTHSQMTLDTIFDLASLTKVFTALSIIILAEQGEIHLRSPVAAYIPEFGQQGKSAITIEQLLLHISGLQPTNDISEYNEGPEKALQAIYSAKPESEMKYRYSDIGYIVLGKLIEKVSGKTLDNFMQEYIFRPLEMHNTYYQPPLDKQSLIAPTGNRDGLFIQGQVHDPRAYALGGIAGHAGLFSTANDLAIFCRMILHSGTHNQGKIISPLGITRMTKMHMLPEGKIRGLGVDIYTEHSTCMGDFFPLGTFGHTGFTGTSLLLDPVSQIFIIILTNRVHCENGNVIPLRAHIANIIAAAL